MNKINFNELTLENAGQWPMAVKWLVAAILALFIIGIGYWVLIKPNFEEYEHLQTQEDSLKSEFEQKQQLAANLQAYRNQLQIMTERFENILKKLPAQNEMPGLLEDISKTGVASGLTFELFAPQPEKVHDFYIEVPINIEVVGSYHQLAVFLSRVAQMNRIVTLHDFEVTAVSDDKNAAQQNNSAPAQKPPSGDLLDMKLTAKIYRYKTS